MSTPQLSVDARPGVRAVMLRWLLVTLILTGVIAMHVLSQHDAAGGHHGSIIEGSAPSAAGMTHGDHGQVESATPAAAGVPAVMPAAPAGDGAGMAACILFLVIGAGAVLLSMLTALRRRIEPIAARAAASLATAVPRGPPHIGPPRISLCVLRV